MQTITTVDISAGQRICVIIRRATEWRRPRLAQGRANVDVAHGLRIEPDGLLDQLMQLIGAEEPRIPQLILAALVRLPFLEGGPARSDQRGSRKRKD